MILALSVSCYTVALAQDPEDNTDPLTNDVPIDGGISILLAGGAAYGVKKLKEKKSLNNKA